jgi:ATP-binding cassette, subfamily C (CFTR/MRP), member 1
MSNDEKRLEVGLDERDAPALEEKAADPSTTAPLEQVGTEKELEALGNEKDANVLTRKITTVSTAESSDDGMGKGYGSGGRISKKTWSERLNPLKYRKIPSIPKERAVSREYGASLWSVLTFSWITPIMTV